MCACLRPARCRAPSSELEPALAAPAATSFVATFDTVGALRERVLAGEAADVVILSEAGMAALAKAGRIDAGSLIDLGTTSVALAVRKGAAVPDVSLARGAEARPAGGGLDRARRPGARRHGGSAFRQRAASGSASRRSCATAS